MVLEWTSQRTNIIMILWLCLGIVTAEMQSMAKIDTKIKLFYANFSYQYFAVDSKWAYKVQVANVALREIKRLIWASYSVFFLTITNISCFFSTKWTIFVRILHFLRKGYFQPSSYTYSNEKKQFHIKNKKNYLPKQYPG